MLPLRANADPPTVMTFWVRNGTATERTVRHPDDFGTAYLSLRFPVGCLSSLDGRQLTAQDSVLVTVDPRAGSYGFTLSPSGLEFTLSNPPTVDFSYGLYGDLAVADGVPSFADRSAYAAALDVWEEVAIDGWHIARDSSPSGVDAVESAVAASGTFIVAARR